MVFEFWHEHMIIAVIRNQKIFLSMIPIRLKGNLHRQNTHGQKDNNFCICKLLHMSVNVSFDYISMSDCRTSV